MCDIASQAEKLDPKAKLTKSRARYSLRHVEHLYNTWKPYKRPASWPKTLQIRENTIILHRGK